MPLPLTVALPLSARRRPYPAITTRIATVPVAASLELRTFAPEVTVAVQSQQDRGRSLPQQD